MGQFHDKLRSLLIKSHLDGNFKLPNNELAGDYFDLAPLFLSPNSLRMVSHEVMTALSSLEFNALGCLELCPVSLLGAILSRTFADKRGFVVRKARKGYGTDRLIEGDTRSGDRVIILEDVTSTGLSVMKVVYAVEELGCDVVCILAVINRREGCDELLKNYDFRYLFVKEELNGQGKS